MALSWKNITVARTNCGADVFGLAGFLRDDDLICHDGLIGRVHLTPGTYHEHTEAQATINPTPDSALLGGYLRRVSADGIQGDCLRSFFTTEREDNGDEAVQHRRLYNALNRRSYTTEDDASKKRSRMGAAVVRFV